MNVSYRPIRQNKKGFTIVELMIAIAVLSLMLLLATVIMVNIGRLYYKGVNSARTQDAARNVISAVSRPLQFSGDTPMMAGPGTPGSLNAICIGTVRFSYILDRQIASNPTGPFQVYHVLWRDTMTVQGICNPLNINISSRPTDAVSRNDGQELMPDSMRLNDLTLSNVSPYRLSINVLYGDYDLSPTGSCTAQEGGQFCARAELTTVVTKRL